MDLCAKSNEPEEKALLLYAVLNLSLLGNVKSSMVLTIEPETREHNLEGPMDGRLG